MARNTLQLIELLSDAKKCHQGQVEAHDRLAADRFMANRCSNCGKLKSEVEPHGCLSYGCPYIERLSPEEGYRVAAGKPA